MPCAQRTRPKLQNLKETWWKPKDFRFKITRRSCGPVFADVDAEERIVNALNDDPAFVPVMLDYIDEAAKHRCD